MDLSSLDDALMAHDGDEEKLSSTRVVVSPLRWWIVAQYSLFALLQGWYWAIPGTISDSYTATYGVDSFTIQLLVNYGPIFYLPFAIPFGFWMDGGFGAREGLRYSVILGSVLVTAGAALRCIARDAGTLSLVWLHLSYVLNAIAGPVAMSGVSKVSEEWFPPSQRALSTALAANANGLGAAIAFLLGPQFVGADSSFAGLMDYNWLCLGLTALNTVAIVAYWPSRPPHPPSLSAGASGGSSSR